MSTSTQTFIDELKTLFPSLYQKALGKVGKVTVDNVVFLLCAIVEAIGSKHKLSSEEKLQLALDLLPHLLEILHDQGKINDEQLATINAALSVAEVIIEKVEFLINVTHLPDLLGFKGKKGLFFCC